MTTKPWEGKHWIEHVEYAKNTRARLFEEKNKNIYRHYEHLTYVYEALLMAQEILKKDWEEQVSKSTNVCQISRSEMEK